MWVVDSPSQSVYVHQVGRPPRALSMDDVLDGSRARCNMLSPWRDVPRASRARAVARLSPLLAGEPTVPARDRTASCTSPRAPPRAPRARGRTLDPAPARVRRVAVRSRSSVEHNPAGPGTLAPGGRGGTPQRWWSGPRPAVGARRRSTPPPLRPRSPAPRRSGWRTHRPACGRTALPRGARPWLRRLTARSRVAARSLPARFPPRRSLPPARSRFGSRGSSCPRNSSPRSG